MAGASMKDIKMRLKSVENTMQITKAMELVASSKLIKAKKHLENSKEFFEILKSTLSDIIKNNREVDSVYLKERDTNKICCVVIAGDRGLAGGYNSNIFKTVASVVSDCDFSVVPVGKKTVDYFEKNSTEIIKSFPSAELLSIADCFGIGNMLANEYKNGSFDKLYIVYTEFVSMMNQEPCVVQLLPFEKDTETQKEAGQLTMYEPGAEAVFDGIVPQYIAGVLYGATAQALASEQAARRTAMESASKNAGEMIDDLNIKFNRARQGAITQEITEIVSGAEAL